MSGQSKIKKPFYKRWWFWVIVVLVIGAVGAGGTGVNKADQTASTGSTSSQEAAQEQSIPREQDAHNTEIVLVGGEVGEYGKIIDLHQGDEVVESRYEYSIPAGVYEATNSGSSAIQLDIVADEITKNEEGVEEQEAIGRPTVLKPGDKATVEVKEGYNIELEKGETLTLSRQ